MGFGAKPCLETPKRGPQLVSDNFRLDSLPRSASGQVPLIARPPGLSTAMPSADVEAFRKVFASSKHIIAVAGAGLSAASGESHVPWSRPELMLHAFQASPRSEGLVECGGNMMPCRWPPPQRSRRTRH